MYLGDAVFVVVEAWSEDCRSQENGAAGGLLWSTSGRLRSNHTLVYQVFVYPLASVAM